jgi:hypothetical protein
VAEGRMRGAPENPHPPHRGTLSRKRERALHRF